ncbi:MAG: hypothetical protein HY842_18575 [Bacteroidetes bacterium]|nr:hypothetical protein [Bacteroidota bacterium]
MEKLSDLRFIIGLFFAIVGALLVLLAFTATYGPGFGKNLNLYSGLVMLVFGIFMLWLNRRG